MLTAKIQQGTQQPLGVHLNPATVLVIMPQHYSNPHERRSPESSAG
jgi:hypothetical protein